MLSLYRLTQREWIRYITQNPNCMFNHKDTLGTQRVRLEHIPLNQKAMLRLCQTIKRFRPLTIDLRDNKIGDEGMAVLADILKEIKVVHLRLQRQPFTKFPYRNLLIHCQTVDITSCTLDPKNWIQLFNGLGPSTKTLKLHTDNYFTEKMAKALSNRLKELPIQTLRLFLSGLGKRGANILADAIKRIDELYLYYIGCSALGAKKLISSFCGRFLTLRYTMIKPETANGIKILLQSNNLRELNIIHCPMKDKSYIKSFNNAPLLEICRICDTIGTFKGVQTLLENTTARIVDVSGWNHIVGSFTRIKLNPAIRNLTMSLSQKAFDTEKASLSKFIRTNQTLRKLTIIIEWLPSRPLKWDALRKALQDNSTLLIFKLVSQDSEINSKLTEAPNINRLARSSRNNGIR